MTASGEPLAAEIRLLISVEVMAGLSTEDLCEWVVGWELEEREEIAESIEEVRGVGFGVDEVDAGLLVETCCCCCCCGWFWWLFVVLVGMMGDVLGVEPEAADMETESEGECECDVSSLSALDPFCSLSFSPPSGSLLVAISSLDRCRRRESAWLAP